MVLKLYSYLYLGDKWYLESYTNADSLTCISTCICLPTKVCSSG